MRRRENKMACWQWLSQKLCFWSHLTPVLIDRWLLHWIRKRTCLHQHLTETGHRLQIRIAPNWLWHIMPCFPFPSMGNERSCGLSHFGRDGKGPFIFQTRLRATPGSQRPSVPARGGGEGTLGARRGETSGDHTKEAASRSA